MTAAAAPSAKTKQTTDYVVIREAADEYLPGKDVDVTSFGATLAIVGTFKAASATDAVKQAAGDKEGVYRAIPKRSWKPITVTIKTETKVTLS